MRSPVNTANSHILKSETVNWLVNTATRSKFRKLKCLWHVNFKMRDYIDRQVTPPTLPYSGLRDSGEKSFSKKKCQERAVVGESLFSRRHRPFSQVAHVLFSLCSFTDVTTILSESLVQVTTKRLTSTTWGLPPPCKQAPNYLLYI